jgi:hypothetical protein
VDGLRRVCCLPPSDGRGRRRLRRDARTTPPRRETLHGLTRSHLACSSLPQRHQAMTGAPLLSISRPPGPAQGSDALATRRTHRWGCLRPCHASTPGASSSKVSAQGSRRRSFVRKRRDPTRSTALNECPGLLDDGLCAPARVPFHAANPRHCGPSPASDAPGLFTMNSPDRGSAIGEC